MNAKNDYDNSLFQKTGHNQDKITNMDEILLLD